MQCPNCKTESKGRFCPSCGSALGGSACPACGSSLAPGARFCTQCGRPAQGGRAGSTVPLSWVVAAAAIIVAAVAFLVPRGGGSAAAPGAAAPFAGMTGGSAAALDPLSGTPREQADRLFDRIMRENSSGNVDQARFFTPMAIQAYGMAEPLDADGLYHLSLVQAVAGDYPAAQATAQRILDALPTHLLGLGALAEAALAAGDTATARGAWRSWLDNLLSEKAKGLPEYSDHALILESYEATARKLLGG
jgi:tetratricopeptide (TPR) repeat protein